MLIGLDVGGTHTDGVLLRKGGAKPFEIVSSVKVGTRPHDVLEGILEALESLLSAVDASKVSRLCVSTTLGLNALLTGNAAPVGMLAVPGPGIDPLLFWGRDPLFHCLSGAQDHRGQITAEPDATEIRHACAMIRKQGARALGIVCKFGPKNPEMERKICDLARQELGHAIPVITGASTGGALNFPRRLHTVWCNAGLAETAATFVRSLKKATRDLGLSCPVVVLKADAGTYPARQSAEDPASSMGSGPAASLLGVWALASHKSRTPDAEDVLMIDMGGTTTDLALMAGGHPLLAPEGLTVCGRPTLIRSLWTRSIALGGDSCLRFGEGGLLIGPDRSSLPLAQHKDRGSVRPPTLTDALNTLGLSQLGDPALSVAALSSLAAAPESPTSAPDILARQFVETALESIRRESQSLLAEVNSRPVYTIRDLLVEKALEPGRAVFIGGPAVSLAMLAEKALGLPVSAPEPSAVANAIGAALARPTRMADLYADTLLGHMSIPDFGVEKPVDSRYDLNAAKNDMQAAFESISQEGLTMHAAGVDPMQALQYSFAESFAMLDDQGRRGRSIRLRAQQAAGLIWN